MTKEQLLASLKPLEWFESEYYQGSVSYIELCQVAFIKLQYAIALDEDFNFYRLLLNDEELYSDTYQDLEAAQKVAQKHYNNLVLELFNWEEE